MGAAVALLVVIILFSAVSLTSLVLASFAYQQTVQTTQNPHVHGVEGPRGLPGPPGEVGPPGAPYELATFNHDLLVENVNSMFEEIDAHAEGWWDPLSGVGELVITGHMQAKTPAAGQPNQIDRCRVHVPHRQHWHWNRDWTCGGCVGRCEQGRNCPRARHLEEFTVDHHETYSGSRSHVDVSFDLDVENFEVHAVDRDRPGFEVFDTVLEFDVNVASTDVSLATGDPGMTSYEVVLSLTPLQHSRDRCERRHCRWCRDRC
jgi:hypothetical protein